MRKKDLTDQKFNRLTVYEEWYNPDTKRWMAFCICECGSTTDVRKNSLKSGDTKSCGCLRRDKAIGAKTKHGHCINGKQSKEYEAWQNIIARCYNPNYQFFSHYGGRGIKVCDRWRYSFENFLEDMGRAPGPEYSIDRIDNDGDYCPENCRWATKKEQQRNKRNNAWLEYDGILKTKIEWVEEYGINYTTLHVRLKLGWSVEKALTTPVRKRSKK